jgi:hypothetical protein
VAPVEASDGVTNGTVTGGTHDLVFETEGGVSEISVVREFGWKVPEYREIERGDSRKEISEAWGEQTTDRYTTDVPDGDARAAVDVELGQGVNLFRVTAWPEDGNDVRVYRFRLRVKDDAKPSADVVVEPRPNGDAYRVIGTVSDDVQLAGASVRAQEGTMYRTGPVEGLPTRNEAGENTIPINERVTGTNVTLRLTDTAGRTNTIDVPVGRPDTPTERPASTTTPTANGTPTPTATPTPTPTAAPTPTATPTPQPASSGGGLWRTIVGGVGLLAIIGLALSTVSGGDF